ncbi:MAG: hypothetical protein ABI386_06735 [Rhodanobacter sp.]
MSTTFWLKRFFTVLLGAFAIICVAQLLKGHRVDYSVTQAAVWGLLSALVFTTGRYFQARRGRHCALCSDTPEMQRDRREA